MTPPASFAQPLFTLLAEIFGVSERPDGFFLDTGQSGLVAQLSARSAWSDEALTAAMMLLAHCAYHVGEIRQRIAWVASPTRAPAAS